MKITHAGKTENINLGNVISLFLRAAIPIGRDGVVEFTFNNEKYLVTEEDRTLVVRKNPGEFICDFYANAQVVIHDSIKYQRMLKDFVEEINCIRTR